MAQRTTLKWQKGKRRFRCPQPRQPHVSWGSGKCPASPRGNGPAAGIPAPAAAASRGPRWGTAGTCRQETPSKPSRPTPALLRARSRGRASLMGCPFSSTPRRCVTPRGEKTSPAFQRSTLTVLWSALNNRGAPWLHRDAPISMRVGCWSGRDCQARQGHSHSISPDHSHPRHHQTNRLRFCQRPLDARGRRRDGCPPTKGLGLP